jgi:hypothetical protein
VGGSVVPGRSHSERGSGVWTQGETLIPLWTPKEVYTGIRPDVSHLRRFGSVCYCHVLSEKRTKLDLTGEKGILEYPLIQWTKIVIPMFPPACKYNYNLPIDYGQTKYVWTLELMNLFIIKGNVDIYVFFVIK